MSALRHSFLMRCRDYGKCTDHGAHPLCNQRLGSVNQYHITWMHRRHSVVAGLERSCSHIPRLLYRLICHVMDDVGYCDTNAVAIVQVAPWMNVEQKRARVAECLGTDGEQDHFQMSCSGRGGI